MTSDIDRSSVQASGAGPARFFEIALVIEPAQLGQAIVVGLGADDPLRF